MKASILVFGVAVALAGAARAQTNPPDGSLNSSNAVPADTLVTKLGDSFHHYHVDTVDPGGLTISYVPEGGGIGIQRIPFEFLPDDLQKQYGYNPQKAAQYEVERKKAMAEWTAKMIADDRAYREKRAQLEAAEAAAEAAAKQGTNAATLASTNPPDLQNTNAPSLTATNQPPAANQPPPPPEHP